MCCRLHCRHVATRSPTRAPPTCPTACVARRPHRWSEACSPAIRLVAHCHYLCPEAREAVNSVIVRVALEHLCEVAGQAGARDARAKKMGSMPARLGPGAVRQMVHACHLQMAWPAQPPAAHCFALPPAGTTAAAAAAGLPPLPPHLVHRNGGALGQHILVDAVVVVPAVVGLVTLQAFRRAQMLILSERGGSGRQRRQAGDSAGGRPVVTCRRPLWLCSAAATGSRVHVMAAPAGRSADWRAWSRRRPAPGSAPPPRRASAGRRTF